jgi:hypothetical protein
LKTITHPSFKALISINGQQVDANSIGSVLPAFSQYGLLSGMIGYFIHQLTAGIASNLTPHIISLSWEVVPLMQQTVKVAFADVLMCCQNNLVAELFRYFFESCKCL